MSRSNIFIFIRPHKVGRILRSPRRPASGAAAVRSLGVAKEGRDCSGGRREEGEQEGGSCVGVWGEVADSEGFTLGNILLGLDADGTAHKVYPSLPGPALI